MKTIKSLGAMHPQNVFAHFSCKVAKVCLYKKSWLVFIFFLALSFLFWHKSLLYPNTYLFEDLGALNFPLKNFQHQMFLSKKFFFWNPYVFSGLPYQADLTKGCFYPLSLLFYLLPTERAIPWHFFIHFALAGFFMYLLLSHIQTNSMFSIAGGIGFMFTSLFVVHCNHLIFISTGCWYPLVVLYYIKTIEEKSLTFLGATSILLAIEILAGMVAIILYSIIFLFFLWLYFIFLQTPKRYFTVISFPLIMIVALLGIAFQALPFIELSHYTFRSLGSGYDFSTTFSLTPRMLISLIIPDFYGNPFCGDYRGDWNWWETCFYVGIMPLVLALIGVFFSKNKYKFFLVGMNLFSILAALGPYTPVHKILYYLVPFYSSFRSQSRWSFIFSFTINILFALGGEVLFAKEKKKFLLFFFLPIIGILWSEYYLFSHPLLTQVTRTGINWFIINLGMVLFFFILYYFKGLSKHSVGVQRLKLYGILAIFILLLDLWHFGYSYNRVYPDKEAQKDLPLFSALKSSKGLTRAILLTHPAVPVEYANWGLVKNVQTVQGYEPSALADYMEYIFFNETQKLPKLKDICGLITNSNLFLITNPATPLTGLLNVRYYFKPRKYSNNKIIGELAENPFFLPRSFLVHSLKVIPQKEFILSFLYNSTIKDLQRQVILEEKPSFSLSPPAFPEPLPSIVKYSPDEIIIEAKVASPAILFLSEIYYPAWRVTVDEKSEKMLRVNYIFRGVMLTAGNHKIRFFYYPYQFYLGLAISIFTWITLLISIVILKRRISK